MALSHRKLVVADKKYASPCYMCYVCPDDCYIPPQPPPPPPPPSPEPAAPQKHQISTTLILMLCILSVAFLLLSYLTITRYRSRNSRRRNSPESLENGNLREDFLDENQGPVLDHPIWYIRTVGLPQSVIDSISVFKYKKGEGLIEGCDCSVCLSEFQENESLRLLPKCSHAFHLPCIDTWLRSHKNCPVCRAPILISSVANNNNNNNNNIQVSSVESSSSESGSMEENQAQNEFETRVQVGTDETRQNRGVAENRCIEKFRVLSDLADHRVKLDQELQQPVRRSVSMDFSSALKICDEVANKKLDEGCSESKFEIFEKQKNSDMGCKNSTICRLIKSSSYRRSLQKGPVSMKRSFSFSGKRSWRKDSRSLESIPIPELSIQK